MAVGFALGLANIRVREMLKFYINPLYTGGLFHCYMLDKSICHFKGAGPFCCFYSTFDGKSC